MTTTEGEIDHESNDFNPFDLLTDFDLGSVSTFENGQTLREYTFFALNNPIEFHSGIEYPVWTYN